MRPLSSSIKIDTSALFPCLINKIEHIHAEVMIFLFFKSMKIKLCSNLPTSSISWPIMCFLIHKSIVSITLFLPGETMEVIKENSQISARLCAWWLMGWWCGIIWAWSIMLQMVTIIVYIATLTGSWWSYVQLIMWFWEPKIWLNHAYNWYL